MGTAFAGVIDDAAFFHPAADKKEAQVGKKEKDKGDKYSCHKDDCKRYSEISHVAWQYRLLELKDIRNMSL